MQRSNLPTKWSGFVSDSTDKDGRPPAFLILSVYLLYTKYIAGMCPQWSAVVGTDHHSEKIATTQTK